MACIYLLNSRGGPQSLDFVIITYSYPLVMAVLAALTVFTVFAVLSLMTILTILVFFDVF